MHASAFRSLQNTFRTDLSEILYLVHLLDLLGLPASWGREDGNDTTLTPQMSGWAIVEALARGLLGESHKAYASDPIWTTLAGLDGREPGTPIGVGLPVRAEFRLPADWLKRFGPVSHSWVALQDGSRLRLIDPTHGYLVADIPLNGKSPKQAADCQVEAYLKRGVVASYVPAFALFSLPFPELPPDVAESLSEPAAWWLVRVLGFVRFLLPTMPKPAPTS